MIREIKFRGKRVDNGEWVVGMLCYSHEGCHIIESEYFKPSNGETPELTDVLPQTVGQFTGLTDKDGFEIYEGDIVALGAMSIRVFEFYKKCFWLIHQKSQFKFPINLVTDEHLLSMQVIGNIHDTPTTAA